MTTLTAALERLDQDQAPAATAGIRTKRMTDRDGAVEQDEVLELRSGLRDSRAVSFIGVAQPLCVLERIENLINAGAAEKPGGEPQRDQGRALRAPERRASEHIQEIGRAHV